MFERSWVRIPAPYTGWTFKKPDETDTRILSICLSPVFKQKGRAIVAHNLSYLHSHYFLKKDKRINYSHSVSSPRSLLCIFEKYFDSTNMVF